MLYTVSYGWHALYATYDVLRNYNMLWMKVLWMQVP